jgi:hypothetical protein
MLQGRFLCCARPGIFASASLRCVVPVTDEPGGGDIMIEAGMENA